MAKELKDIGPAAVVAQIEYSGEKLTLPEGMDIPDAIKLLQSRQAFLEEDVVISREFDVFPYDGAYATKCVLDKMFGWSNMAATPSWFGPQPPKLISIRLNAHRTVEVPWGRFKLSTITGFLQTGVHMNGKRFGFQLLAAVKRKDEATVQRIFNLVTEELKINSLYRGQALKIRFRDDDGEALEMPTPTFIDTTIINPDELIYSKEVTDSVNTNLFTPIQRIKDMMRLGMPVKRGVLLGGTYGTGKTMAAHVASKFAVEAGITYVYVPRADELSDAIEFAKQYQSPACVVFCEDVDRVMRGERSVAMDDILNIIDGIDTKNANIITVLTTNELSKINPAMLRPGRLDAVIEVTPPDAEAAGRLIRLYGGAAIHPKADLTRIGEYLVGAIPAVIAEVVRRSKLAQLRRTSEGAELGVISEDALLESARTMQRQLTLLKENGVKPTSAPTIDGLMLKAMAKVISSSPSQWAAMAQDA